MIIINKEKGLADIVNKLYDEIPDDVLSDMDESFVINHEDYLNEKYSSLYKSKGFEDFYSMYLYGRSDFVSDQGGAHKRGKDTVSKATSKNKDTSKLQLVKRTVVRNGKPTVLSFYQDSNGTSDSKEKNSTGSANSDSSGDGSGTTGIFTGGPKFGKPLLENISLANPPDTFYKLGSYRSSLYDYIFDVADGIQGVMGVKKVKGYIIPSYIAVANKEYLVQEATVLTKRVVLLCWYNHYGVKIPVGYADKLMEYLGLKKRNGFYSCSDLSSLIGDVPWE